MRSKPLVVPLPRVHGNHKFATLKKLKRAYVVMGVPSSGTRLMARLLIAAGCTSDNPTAAEYTHNDFWEHKKPVDNLIVVRRHVAIGRPPSWAKDENIFKALELEGYDVFGIVMSRNQIIVEQSMLAAPHTDTLAKARGQVQFCWKSIFENIPWDVPFEVIQYESLVKESEAYLKLIEARLGLVFPDSIESIVDGNSKYWNALKESGNDNSQ